MVKTALVTGGNQGLGLAFVKGLAAVLAPEDTVYLAARSEERGRAAVAELGETTASVRFIQLDVTSQSSINSVAEHLRSAHGGVDYVIPNAAARMTKDQPQAEQVRGFVAVNNHGSRNLFDALAPLLNRNACYLMVASSFGQLSNLLEHLHPLFDTDRLSLDDIEASIDAYVTALEAGSAADDGWPDWINIPSKIGQVATARVAAREVALVRPDDDIVINAVCPGLIDTAASRPWFEDMSSAQTPDQAAKPVIDLVLSPSERETPRGQLVKFGEVLRWA